MTVSFQVALSSKVARMNGKAIERRYGVRVKLLLRGVFPPDEREKIVLTVDGPMANVRKLLREARGSG